jgi:nucleotide-binding universal stress UspA family protein
MKNKNDAMEKPILVPVDFSPDSEAALTFAAELADMLKAPLLVLHVVHDPGQAPGYYSVKGAGKHLQKMEDVAAEMLQEFMQDISRKHQELGPLKAAETKLVTGIPVSRILEIAEKTDARMIVMGSQGRTGLAHALLGSKAEQVVRLAPVPVTIAKVPDRRKTTKHKKKEDQD